MNPPLDAVKAVIKQFVIHHDGCTSADMCFTVLQNERGLSCHFLIDNDGTIYQTIDLALMAYHAAEWNTASIGVEFCNRGDAKKEPNYYSSGRFGPQARRQAVQDQRQHDPRVRLHEGAVRGASSSSAARCQRLLAELARRVPAVERRRRRAWDTMPTSRRRSGSRATSATTT